MIQEPELRSSLAEWPSPLTGDEFETWCFAEDVREEYADGEAVRIGPVSRAEEDLRRFLDRLLGACLEPQAVGVLQ